MLLKTKPRLSKSFLINTRKIQTNHPLNYRKLKVHYLLICAHYQKRDVTDSSLMTQANDDKRTSK